MTNPSEKYEKEPENIINEDTTARKVPKEPKEPKENQQDSVAIYERALKEGIELGKKLKKPEIEPAPPKIDDKKDEKKRNVFFGMGDDI